MKRLENQKLKPKIKCKRKTTVRRYQKDAKNRKNIKNTSETKTKINYTNVP